MGKYRRVSRWEHEAVMEKLETRMEENPLMMRVRKSTVDHPFGTLKCWMGATHFQMKTLERVSGEMSLQVKPQEIGISSGYKLNCLKRSYNVTR